MEIQPASLAQVSAGRGGQMVEIDPEVSDVASGLYRIDHHIRLRFSEAGNYFVVYWKPDEWDEGDGYMIFTAQELDQRIVKHMERVYYECRQPGYSYADAIEKADKKAKAEEDKAWTDKHGEMFERMAFAMRKDLGYNNSKAFITKELTSA